MICVVNCKRFIGLWNIILVETHLMFFWCDDDHFWTAFDSQWARAATKITKFIYLLLFMKRKLILSHIILKITNEIAIKLTRFLYYFTFRSS